MKKYVFPILAVVAVAGLGFYLYKKKSGSKSTSSVNCTSCSEDEIQVANNPATPQMEIVINDIKKSPEWLEIVKDKAKKMGRPLELQLKLDAAWFIKHQS